MSDKNKTSMNRPKVFVTRKIPDRGIRLLINNGFEVDVFGKDIPVSKKDLLKRTANADAILSLLTDIIDKDVINNARKCRIISNYAVGYNNIDVSYAKSKGIIITNTPDVLTSSTADLAMTLALAASRRIIEGDSMMREGKFKGWKPELLLGHELNGKIFGIAGAGRIGTATAIRAAAFGCKIIYFNSSVNTQLETQTAAKKVSLNFLMKNSDFVSLHLPLTEKTRGLINREKLKLLKPSAVFINTARGEIVDEDYLIMMLENKRIFSAGFDVYKDEPDINKKLLKLKNVVLLPHIGSATIEARDKMAELAAQNIVNVLKGKKPVTPV
ncbi:MAG: glyoxylate reductase [Ignavibacteriaceae bacterium]